MKGNKCCIFFFFLKGNLFKAKCQRTEHQQKPQRQNKQEAQTSLANAKQSHKGNKEQAGKAKNNIETKPKPQQQTNPENATDHPEQQEGNKCRINRVSFGILKIFINL